MSRALRFLASNRFNFVDVVCIGAAGLYAHQGSYVAAPTVLFVGLLISAVLERLSASTGGRP
jgi:hypothetical protein